MVMRLKQEVWELDRCSGCGACVAACNKLVLYWGDAQHPLLEERIKHLGLSETKLDTCTFCPKLCEAACPRLKEWTVLQPRLQLSARGIGVSPAADPNGVICNLLVAARSAGLIDGVVIMDVDPWSLQPAARVAVTVAEIADALGMQGLWTPVLDGLNDAVHKLKLRHIAVVGAPCVAEAVRNIRETDEDEGRLSFYRDAIRLSIATFCTGVYMPNLVSDYFERELGISPETVRSLVRSESDGTLTATFYDGSARTIPLAAIEGYTRKGCAVCGDFVGESADIGVGLVGAKEGYVTLITRSAIGNIAVRNAVNLGLLEAVEEVNLAALEQATVEKERRDRAQAFDDLQLLMLDALSDPQKRAEVRTQLARLYKVPPSAQIKEEKSDVICSGC